MSEADAAFWTMIGTAVTGLATVALAFFSFKTTLEWKNGIGQQRIDEALIALEDCGAQIGKVIEAKRRNVVPPRHWSEFEEAWAKWSRFKGIYAVARRYRRSAEDVSLTGNAILDRLKDFCHENGSGSAVAGQAINSDFGDMKLAVSRQLK